MISVVIRNRNEATSLERVLKLLRTVYREDIDEIIVVDNNSSDDSVIIAEKYACNIIQIDEFTYGRATNKGIEAASQPYILLLSAHAVPAGASFFKNTLKFVGSKTGLAGLRYINSIQNLERTLCDGPKIKDPLKYGLMAACCLVSKEVWTQHKFNEKLVFSEDKEWSARTAAAGYGIYEINETFLYFARRSEKGNLNRLKNETIAACQLTGSGYPSMFRIILSLVKHLLVDSTKAYLRSVRYHFKIALVRLQILKYLKHNHHDL